jgi:hypothetical protein
MRHCTSGLLLVLVLVGCGGGGVNVPTCRTGSTPLPVSAAPGPCAPLSVQHAICGVGAEEGLARDQFVWSDDTCHQRTADMIPNISPDASGGFGGYMQRYTYAVGGAVRVCPGSSRRHPGFGFVVNHLDSSARAMDSRWRMGSATTTVLEGRHHAIHEYVWDYPLGDHPVHIIAQWLFATGRPYPLWAITFDATAAPPDAIMADTRAPYGDIAWDGGVGANVDGVGWGDRNQFATLASPVTLKSGWDYTAPNLIPFVRTWSNDADAEMGLVQTQTFMQHDAGGSQFYVARGTKKAAGPMPQPSNWPYQLNQYELDGFLASKRVAWGSNFGAVGQRAYKSYGDDRTLVGYPYQSYSVHVVMDRHATDPVRTQVRTEEAVQRSTLRATGATLDTSGPAGIHRPDPQTFEPPGYNPVYGTWEVHATGGAVTLTLETPAKLPQPMFVVHGWSTGNPTLRLDSKRLTADTDYYATYDVEHSDLWVTLAKTVEGAAILAIE